MMSRRSAFLPTFLTAVGFLSGCGRSNDQGRKPVLWAAFHRNDPSRKKMLEKLRNGYPALPPPSLKNKKKKTSKIDY